MPSLRLLFSLLIALICLPSLQAKWPLAADDLKFLSDGSTDEEGLLWVPPGKTHAALENLVCENWQDLLAHLDDIPEYRTHPQKLIQVIGRGAEFLPPLTYLDFLDQFITLYQAGMLTGDALRMQLAGTMKKRLFLDVNHWHPRVRAIMRRVRESIPPDDEPLNEIVASISAGDSGDCYTEGVDPVPETLPGILLPWQFRLLVLSIAAGITVLVAMIRRKRSHASPRAGMPALR